MSTKKDKFSTEDKNFMRLALNLARARKGLTGDNPSVGCVIVKNNKLISIGQTGHNGRPHAETNAITNAFQNLQGSKIYITLEPCNHYGRTPPCTKNIIKSGISEVIYSINDIDDKVKGKSLKILTGKGVKVKTGLLRKEIIKHYDSYIINRKYKIPFITAKIAVSKNKLIYSKGTKRITNKISDKLTHYLRYKNDAIMISSKTLNIDNPKLNCRLDGYEHFSPKRIILDRKLNIRLKTNVYKTVKKNNTVIFHNSKNISKIKSLKKKGISLIRLKSINDKFDLKDIFKKLYIIGIRNLLVEGGDKLTKDLLKKKLVNQFYLFESPKNLAKDKNFVSFTSRSVLKKNYKIRSNMSSKLAKDKITIYKR